MLRDKQTWVTGAVLARQARERRDDVFLEFVGGETLTFGETDVLASRVAQGFHALGVRPGDRVGVMLPNGRAYCAAWFGISRAGVVHVALNTGLVGAFLAHVLASSDVSLLVCDAEYLPRIAEIQGALPNLRRILVTRAHAEETKRVQFAHIEVMPIELLESAEVAAPAAWVTYRDLACIMFTSGTTGPSKGVLMPHAHCYLLGFGAVENLEITPHDTYYVTLPLFHANAMFMQLYACLIAGARAVIAPRFSASQWLSDIRERRCTLTNTIGVMSDFVMRQPPRAGDRDTSLRLVLAVPTPPALAVAFRERFGAAMVEGYGMTEVNMPIYTPLRAPRDGASGKAYDRYFDVRIVDPETDEELPPNATGEIVVRPKEPFAFMAGYDKLPERTVDAWRSFFFHTGDAGRCDEDGYIYFVDRIKDCIRRRGENISSFEIEAAVKTHVDVLDAAAVAVPSEIVGGEDEVKLTIVLREGGIVTPAAIARYCDSRIPAFAAPRYIDIVEALPKTPTEKIQKGILRSRGVTAQTWDRARAAE